MLARKAQAVTDRPRIAPPMPLRSRIDDLKAEAEHMGITLMPWQEVAGTYLTATGKDGGYAFKEVCVVVARQNGKTELMRPLIIDALKHGKRILHIAQTRELPRLMFGTIAESLDADLFLKRRGKGGRQQTIWPRFGAGSEEIILANGGRYKIAAASQGGARGLTNDMVIIDELREMETDDVIAAAKPTLATTAGQMVYLSNAGTDKSVVLNQVRMRAQDDPSLAYLEWSAAPERMIDDRAGWHEANPALGFTLSEDVLATALRSDTLSGMRSRFETEHLCRWVATMRERLVDEYAWLACEAETEAPTRPYMAVAMDPQGTRASAAVAWQQGDGTVALQVLFDTAGGPVDTDVLGKEVRERARALGVRSVGFDPMTDRELAKFLPKTKAISGSEFDNASSRFELIVKAGRLRWQDAEAVTADLVFTAKKQHDGARFTAVRANDDRPITAALAAIRAVWMASGLPSAALRVY
jgi:phage terminase large subunit-like protein